MAPTEILRHIDITTTDALQIADITSGEDRVSFRDCLVKPKAGHRGNITITANHSKRYDVKIVNKNTQAITEYYNLDGSGIREVFSTLAGNI